MAAATESQLIFNIFAAPVFLLTALTRDRIRFCVPGHEVSSNELHCGATGAVVVVVVVGVVVVVVGVVVVVVGVVVVVVGVVVVVVVVGVVVVVVGVVVVVVVVVGVVVVVVVVGVVVVVVGVVVVVVVVGVVVVVVGVVVVVVVVAVVVVVVGVVVEPVGEELWSPPLSGASAPWGRVVDGTVLEALVMGPCVVSATCTVVAAVTGAMTTAVEPTFGDTVVPTVV